MNHYIHIPFCRSKCRYCHFASFSGTEDVSVKKYLSFLKKEIRGFLDQDNSSPGSSPGCSSIYFGGGTPSILSVEDIKGILDEFKISRGINLLSLEDPSYGHAEGPEITLEANPETITGEYVRGLQKIGINRISIGIQTLNEKSLEEIGRCKTGTIMNTLDILEEVGFSNVGVDFIIGLPYVGKGETKADIGKLLERYETIKHVSVYMLEEGRYPENWKDKSMNEDELGDEYAEVSEFLKSRGFSRYELSNFAKEGYECRHNSGYWNHTQYRGFGLSASSFVGNRRFSNPCTFIGYYAGGIENEEELDADDIETEKLLFSFRTTGVGIGYLKNPNKLEDFIDHSLVGNDHDKISVTDKGVAIADYIFKELFL